MSFREKSAWVCMIGLLAVYGYYFVDSGFRIRDTTSGDAFMMTQMGLMVSIVVVMIVGHIIAAVSSPKDADAQCDERDVLIAAKAGALGGNIAIAGALLAAATAFRGANGVEVGNWVILAVVVGELVRYGMQIAKYRHWL